MEYKVALCEDDEKIASKIMEAFNNELHAHNLEATIDYYSSGNVLIEAVKEKAASRKRKDAAFFCGIMGTSKNRFEKGKWVKCTE